jgi:hypothetical protein
MHHSSFPHLFLHFINKKSFKIVVLRRSIHGFLFQFSFNYKGWKIQPKEYLLSGLGLWGAPDLLQTAGRPVASWPDFALRAALERLGNSPWPTPTSKRSALPNLRLSGEFTILLAKEVLNSIHAS